MSYKTFFVWVFTSVYQGGVIMLFSLVLFEDNLVNIVAITFSALILTELSNVAFEIHTWNRWMILSELVTFIVYFVSLFVLQSYFDITFILSWTFLWKVVVVTAIACLPLYSVHLLKRKLDPPAHIKLQH
jgi:phospholipid-translocating ATPase